MKEYSYEFDMMLKLREVVESVGYKLSVVHGAKDKPNMADFIINVTEDSMLGLKMNSVLADKPFRIFPDGQFVSLDEIKKVLTASTWVDGEEDGF
jgi:hypothetical protein